MRQMGRMGLADVFVDLVEGVVDALRPEIGAVSAGEPAGEHVGHGRVSACLGFGGVAWERAAVCQPSGAAETAVRPHEFAPEPIAGFGCELCANTGVAGHDNVVLRAI